MIACINKSSIQFLNLKKKSGLSESDLESQCRYYTIRYGRFPHLDELRGVDSSKSLSNAIGLRQNGSASIHNILEYTGTQSMEQAVPVLNNEFRDLEIEVVPIVENAKVEVTHRPTDFDKVTNPVSPDEDANSSIIIECAINKLIDLYGIKINRISSQELNSSKWKQVIPDVEFVKGFIYNGEIYLTEQATIDTPLHEMMHLLIGNLRFNNPELYIQLVNSVESWTNRNELAKRFEGRSRNDVNEEIFVEQAALFSLGQPCELSALGPEIQQEIRYNVKRLIDSILMGQASVNAIPDEILFSSTLKEVTGYVGSTIMNNTFKGTFNVEGSALHRKINNIKSDLIQNNELREECD